MNDILTLFMPYPDFDFAAGEMLLIDKPREWTSFDVVKKVRYAVKIKKVGHAGTLDPLATGLLIICTGKMTKQIESFQAQEKEYTGTMLLGKTTPSFDLETDFDSETDASHITDKQIKKAFLSLTGEQDQIPPVFSAIQVKGRRLYEAARKGEDVPVPKARRVNVSTFEMTERSGDEVHFRIVCSKGTYIRSLVSDAGKALQTGACMTALRRTRNGEFIIEDAWPLDKLIDAIREHKEAN